MARTVAAIERAIGKLNQPWGRHQRLIAAFRDEWQAIEAELPEDNIERTKRFRPFDSDEWYTLQIVRYAKLVEQMLVDRPWEAISLAIEIGQLATEEAFKQDLEKAALAGLRVQNAQSAAATARRLHPVAYRKSLVAAEIAKGVSVRQALENVALELGVSVGAVKKDYYAR